MNSVLWDLSKNVSFKFLAQLLLELLVKDWRDVAVKRNFGVKFPFFGRPYLEKYLTDFSKIWHSVFYHGCE